MKQATTQTTGNNTRVLYLSIVLLLVIAFAATTLRTNLRSEDALPTGDSAWSINAWHVIDVAEKDATVSISPPWDTSHARLYSQSLSHPGLNLRRTKTDKKNRDIVLSAPKPGQYTINFTFNVYVSHLPLSEPLRPKLSEQNRADWLASADGIQVNTETTRAIVDLYTHDNPEPERLIELLFNHVSNNIRIHPDARSDSESALNSRRATELGSLRAFLALLRTAHLPARLVTGVDLQTPVQEARLWAEVYIGDEWRSFDPVHGYLNELPIFYIPMRKGDDKQIRTENAAISSSVSVVRALPTYDGLLSSDTRKLTDILDLTRLTLPSREMLSILLLMPLGVLASELLRQFAGIRTYGTFTPTLLALAVTHVDWPTAVIVLALVTIIGVAIRAAMPGLNLQRTPRLAIVFILVAMSMSLVVSGISYFDPAIDSTVTLLPLVILTMLVDRIYTVYDERGVQSALTRLVWTVIAAMVSLYILLQSHWGTFLVSYPEVHAVTLAAILLIGLYRGPKLSDAPAFRWLREPAREVRGRKTDIGQSEQSGDTRKVERQDPD